MLEVLGRERPVVVGGKDASGEVVGEPGDAAEAGSCRLSYFRFVQIGVAATMQRHGFAKARQSGLYLRLLSRLAPESVDARRQLEARVLKHRSHLSN